ncbi:MAG: type II CAAX prenyl endopeptidase Rce1 family protein [Frankiaceae bacterium]
MTREAVGVVAVLLGVPAYYGLVAAPLNGRLAGALLGRSSFGRRLPRMDAEALARTAVGGVTQLLAMLALATVAGLGWHDFVPEDWHPELIGYGVLLGVGEIGLSSFLVSLSMRLAVAVARPGGGDRREDWTAMSTGGWMRAFLTTVRVAPPAVAAALVVLYIAVEETVYRGVVIGALRPYGAAAALLASVTLFMLAQTFNMPSWRNALPPLTAAVVVGLTHGLLLLQVGDITPLIAAHVVLFAMALV